METKGAFLEQLKSDEHLYLFSDRSATRLFQQLGAEHIQFEPAIFGVYDMFFLVGKLPIIPVPVEKVESTLLSFPQGRFVRAMLDMEHRINMMGDQIERIDVDRANRLDQIHALTEQIHKLQVDHGKGPD